MTTIITRLYKDRATAQGVVDALTSAGHDAGTIDVIARDGAATAEARMTEARVPGASASAYGPGIAKGNALLVIRAPFAPIGTARHAIRVANRTAAIDVGVADEDHYVREEPGLAQSGSVLPGTVFYMSNPHRSVFHGHILGASPIRASRPRTSAMSGGGHMSTKFWPMKLLSAPRDRASAIKGGFLISSLFGVATVIREWPSRDLVKTTI